MMLRTILGNVWLYRFILLSAVLTISYMAFMPLQFPEVVGLELDKLHHVLAFLVLSWLSHVSWPKSGFNYVKIVTLVLWGAFIEIVQDQLPYRVFSMYDFSANLVGILLYWLIYRFLLLRFVKIYP